jgi:hypothetical protein
MLYHGDIIARPFVLLQGTIPAVMGTKSVYQELVPMVYAFVSLGFGASSTVFALWSRSRFFC